MHHQAEPHKEFLCPYIGTVQEVDMITSIRSFADLVSEFFNLKLRELNLQIPVLST